jgi:type III pantothenate kinase
VGAIRITADRGNSSLKLVVWDDARIVARGRFETVARGELVRWWRETYRALGPTEGRSLSELEFVALASVAGPDATSAAAVALAEAFELEPGGVRLHPDPGVSNLCQSPETVGLDRLYAARGAAELEPDGCVVLDAGTALTVDAVRTSEGRIEFLGGAIAAGPGLLARALADGGAQLFEVDPAPPVPALGRDTRAALESGVVHGFRGAAAELSRRIGLESGLATTTRVLTGGAAEWLLEPEPFWSGACRHAPDLVQRGLLVAASEAAGT